MSRDNPDVLKPAADLPSPVDPDSRTRHLEVLHEFALSLIDLDSVDEIVWNVAKTAIARLGFVDCVVYLLDESGATLLQRAAHGPKNPVAQDIYNPITIPLGQGIVGDVALTGKPVRIDDTRQDPRYIEDDAFRLSELAVPIIHDGRVIGVLDSEHPEAHFFTDEHVSLFATIASLASTRIDTAMAIERLNQTVSELRRTRDDLSRQADELRKAREEAEKASQEKSLFLANMSHEIRTPMTAIVGYADLLARPEQPEEERIEWAAQVKRSASYLLQLVNELLDLSRIESGVFEPQPQVCEPLRLLEDLRKLIAPLAEAKSIELKSLRCRDVPERIELDSNRVRQICLNLLTNAVKYTDHGSVGIDCRTARRPDGSPELRITVRDTGRGIRPEALEQIFHPFTQDRQAGVVRDGYGLGLTISRALARGLGGELKAHSELGLGSDFVLTVPFVAVDAPAPSEGSPSSASPDPPDAQKTLAGRRILVAEDTASIAQLLKYLLTAAGAEVQLAGDGKQARDAALQAMADGSPHDLVLMDMMMPVLDGYEATRQLRAAGIDTPIVALTAFVMNEDREKCLQAGCDHFLAKPIDPATFTQQVRSYLFTLEGD